ncbi:D-ribose pyranase [Cribrihabitans pelagius]|uniref:D-ribose pyranase n=1 Tax=Cribrihabitans pelagius TaxID=1765746 RepID=UPI003B5C19F6
MKRDGLLNRHLSGLIASLGHMDEIIVADAGLPVPRGVEVIDLAVSRGIPGFWQVLDALRTELVIEAAFCAGETPVKLRERMTQYVAEWGRDHRKTAVLKPVAHAEFKTRAAGARAVVRTDESTPYCNLSLVSEVWF